MYIRYIRLIICIKFNPHLQNHFQLNNDSFLGMAFDFTSMTSTDIEVIVENEDALWSLDETIQRPQPSPGNPWEKTPLNIYASLFNTIHRQTLKPNNNESRFYFTILSKKFKIFKIARKTKLHNVCFQD